MPHAQAGAASKLRYRDVGLRGADMAQCLQFQLNDGFFAEPIRLCQGRQRPKSANARASIMAKRQQQQFQFGFCPLFGPSSNTGDGTNRLIDGGIANIRNLHAARFAPKRVKALSFDFAPKQGAHAGARKTESNPINKIGREHKVSPSA